MFNVAQEMQQEVSLRLYSGRGMFGKQCLAFVVGDGSASFMFQFGMKLALEADCEFDEELEDLLLLTWSSDSMGMDQVFYCPELECNVELLDNLNDECDEDDEDDEESD